MDQEEAEGSASYGLGAAWTDNGETCVYVSVARRLLCPVEKGELARGGGNLESPRRSHRGRLSDYAAGLIMGFCILLIATLLLGPLAGILTLAGLILWAEVTAARRGQR